LVDRSYSFGSSSGSGSNKSDKYVMTRKYPRSTSKNKYSKKGIYNNTPHYPKKEL
jgi:hypothetical protein